MQIYTSPQTDNNAGIPPLSYLQAGCPSCRPTNSIKRLKVILYRNTVFSPALSLVPCAAGVDWLAKLLLLLLLQATCNCTHHSQQTAAAAITIHLGL